MNIREIERWELRFRTPTDYVRIRTGNIYWISALLVLLFFLGIFSATGRIVSPSMGSNSIVETESFIPTAAPTAFPTMMPTEAQPERIKPTGPPQPVPLPPRPANLSLMGIGFTFVVCMLALVLIVLTTGCTKKRFHFLTNISKQQ